MLRWLETKLVYPAPRLSDAVWERPDLSFEDVRFQSEDGTQLHGWFFEHPAPRAHVVFYHGNAQQVAELGDWVAELRETYEISMFVFDYRGYGLSKGSPHEQGVLSDGEAAQRWLADRSQIPMDQVTLWGLSLGGAIAVHCGAELGAKAMILDRTFADIVEIGCGMVPWAPIRRLMKNRYPSVERIKRYHSPLLQIHGPIDEIVPYESGQELFDACPAPDKRFLTIEDFGHLDPPPAEFYQALGELFGSIEPRPASSS